MISRLLLISMLFGWMPSVWATCTSTQLGTCRADCGPIADVGKTNFNNCMNVCAKACATPLPPPVLTTITVIPNPQSLTLSATQLFVARGYDANGKLMAITPAPTWSVMASGGTINSSLCLNSSSCLFTAGNVAGTFTNTVKATSGGISGLASVTVTTPPPPITVTKARIGCLDIQIDGNLTGLVGQACNNKTSCSYKAPTPAAYTAAGVKAIDRTFCTEGMEITYQCSPSEFHTVTVPGNAWDQPPAQLICNAPVNRVFPAGAGAITVTTARIGCLDIQLDGNLTGLVGQACNNKTSCSYKAPTIAAYTAAGVKASDRTFCTEGMEITYRCGQNDDQIVTVPGNAWDQPPAQLICDGGKIATNHQDVTPPPQGQGTSSEPACTSPTLGQPDYYIAPRDMLDWTPHQSQGDYTTKGFSPPQPTLTPAMYNSPPGTPWVGGFPKLNPPEPPQSPPPIPRNPCPPGTPPGTPGTCSPGGDVITPGLPNINIGLSFNRENSGPIAGAPGSTLGANEGRVRAELRAVAHKKDPVHSLCQAAQRFTRNWAASANTPCRDNPGTGPFCPSDHDFGNAFADLSVTGKAAFARFEQLHPNEASLRSQPECKGVPAGSLTTALNRAYQVANALRGLHDSQERKALGWIAVSGEDDQPYLPVNVPSTRFPQFQLKVEVPRGNFMGKTTSIEVNTRYMIAHAQPPTFQRPTNPLVDGGPGRQVPADLLPMLAPDAQVILFIHGMDSRIEEAKDLTEALHKLGGKNWAIISMDLPTSGYADNIDHRRISDLSAVQCHSTPLVDFIEDFIVAFVDTLDGQLHGQLKPKIKAVVGGSLGGNMAMRLGRRPNTPWITHVVPWSPASIWPSYIGQHQAPLAGCDTSHYLGGNEAVDQSLTWAGAEPRFLPDHETSTSGLELRRELFYGGFDWDGGDLVWLLSGQNHQPQAQCWYSDNFQCKQLDNLGARMDRQETYDANFRAWHWRLGAEQLAFSHQQYAPGTQTPLYLLNTKPMLLFSGHDDICAGLGKYTRDVSSNMVNTPGYYRFLNQTGHSLDNEHPEWIAQQIADFLR